MSNFIAIETSEYPEHKTRKQALEWLKSKPLKCALWREKGKLMSAIYWNGKRRIQLASKTVNTKL